MTEEQIKHMADRFLGWALPPDFQPDNGISYTPTQHSMATETMPSGTNLFCSGQALAVSKGAAKEFLGNDGGCFAHALWSVRTFGGVLEHPWDSKAWPWFGLTVPPREGGWVKADNFGGWTCCIEQKTYGHHARKPTMLYAAGCDLPELAWGHTAPVYDQDLIARKGIKYVKKLGEVGTKGGGRDSHWRIYTPPAFRDLLLSIARTVELSISQAAE
jgi:hypothetical protein